MVVKWKHLVFSFTLVFTYLCFILAESSIEINISQQTVSTDTNESTCINSSCEINDQVDTLQLISDLNYTSSIEIEQNIDVNTNNSKLNDSDEAHTETISIEEPLSSVKSPYDPKGEYPNYKDVNWSIFSDVKPANITESLNILRSIPIYHYFDAIKGSYRTNVIGETIESVYPDLVVRLERKHTKNNKQFTYEVPVLDSTIYFMHFIIGVQAAEAQVTELYNKIENMFMNINASHYKLNTLLSKNFPAIHRILRLASSNFTQSTDKDSDVDQSFEWKPSLLLQQEIEVCQTMLSVIESKYKKIANKVSIALAQSEQLHMMKKNLHDEQHEQEISMLNQSYQNLFQIETKRVDEMDRLQQQAMNIQLTMDLEVVKFEHDMAMQRINSTIQTAVDSIKVRGELMAQSERDNEAYHLSLLERKEEMSRKILITSLNELMDDFGRAVSSALEKPWYLVLWLGKLCGVVLGVAVFYELIIATKFLVMKYLLSKNKRVAYSRNVTIHQSNDNHRNVGNKSNMNHDTNTLVLSVTQTFKISEMAEILSMAAAKYRTGCPAPALPSMLLVGPPGVGKSMAAVAIAERACLPYAVLQGADLEAQGPQAGWTLRQLLSDATPVIDPTTRPSTAAYNVGTRPRVLIIDDASPFIRSRSVGTHSHNHNGANISITKQNGHNNHNNDNDRDVTSITHTNIPSDEGQHFETCFFALLQGLRLNTVNLCVILVCSSYSMSSIHGVDRAILDRLVLGIIYTYIVQCMLLF